MIVVHRYISRRDRLSKASGKGPKAAAIGRALAHVKYIQHRPGEDRGEGGREFFDETGQDLNPKELRQLLKTMDEGAVLVHTLTLSPEINLVDKRALTVEMMRKLGGEKGLDLKWFAVEHYAESRTMPSILRQIVQAGF